MPHFAFKTDRRRGISPHSSITKRVFRQTEVIPKGSKTRFRYLIAIIAFFSFRGFRHFFLTHRITYIIVRNSLSLRLSGAKSLPSSNARIVVSQAKSLSALSTGSSRQL